MKRGTPDHPKVLMLTNRLKVKKHVVVGLLELMWHFTARYAPRGDIGRYTDGLVATNLDWDGERAAELIEALVAEHWLDRNNEYRLIVHHWSEHCDDTVDKYLANHGMRYADGELTRRKPDKTAKRMRQADLSRQVATSREKSVLPEPEPEPEPEPHSKGGERGESSAPSGQARRGPPTGGGEGGESSAPSGEDGADARSGPTGQDGADARSDPTGQDGENMLGKPDEAHLILKARPELSLLTWEQDVNERKNVQGLEMYGGGKLDFVAAARWIAKEAITAGPRDAPGYWLRKQYLKYFVKKDAPPGGDQRSDDGATDAEKTVEKAMAALASKGI